MINAILTLFNKQCLIGWWNMSDTLRTFIAIPLPENVISFISGIQERVKAYGFKASWSRPEGIHLTLKFLGDIDSGDAEIAGEAMSQAVKESLPLSLAAKGLGVFPGIKRPRVIWVGLKGDTFPLIELQKKIEEHLKAAGFPKEDRPFRGHLTLARIKGETDPKKLAEAMKKFGEAESETFTADQVVLFRSELKPSGAVYTRLKTSNMIKK